ncbi:hypothetical protein Taro_040355 [Colocasia esculenta]|uniref:Uncharacterized protein n=1 Tax=Colocasia esculenta TaxID=4460 RepID=A0A843WUB0_COLES|nr:hypothetical protein [Colocasia esculenta]
MAELDALKATPYHKLAPEQNPPKPITSLLSRAAIFLLVAALPFFPSQAPEFVNQTLLTRGWELLHLLLVGIAVSYGLFSQRNAESASEKEAALPCADGTPQSYLTQLLQVSPVFDEEGPGTPSGPEESRLGMWTSRYHRGEPTVMVAPGSPGDGRRLLLPVRSLRSPVPHADSPGGREEHEKHWIAGAGALSFPRGRVEDRKVREAGTVLEYPPAQKEELAGDRVVDLPSTIPWRLRSARMDLKEEMANAVAFRSLSFRSLPSRPSSASPSPRRLSPRSSLSPEPRAKSNEDPWKRKVLFNASPPPPPPPPPPFFHKTPSPPPIRKIACRSFRDELTTSNVGNRGRDDDRGWSSDLGSPCSPGLSYYSMGRSVRTVRPREVPRDTSADVATPVTVEKEKRKKKTSEAVDDRAATASDGRDSAEASGCPSNAGELPGAALGGGAVEQLQEAEENEVDKKADEFIAKFREQIRLQRIDSIKKTVAPGISRKP